MTNRKFTLNFLGYLRMNKIIILFKKLGSRLFGKRSVE